MTREVAYDSLLYAERRGLHAKIARSIERQQGAHADEYVEVLAEHYTLAEDWPQALRYHLQAGRRAQDIYANQDAIHRYQSALEITGRIPASQDEQLLAHEALGDTYALIGHYDQALHGYARARAIADALPPSSEAGRHRANLCRKTGRVHENRGEYEVALEWVERGLDLLQAEPCIETAQLYLGGAAVYHREGRFQDAIQWCDRGIEIVGGMDVDTAQRAAAHAYYLLGYSHHRLGSTVQASRHYQHSLDIYATLEDSPGMARAQNNLANLYFDQDDWERATEYYQQALATLERIGDLYGQAVIANNLGGILDNRGDLDSARATYQRSLDLAQELGISGLVALLHSNLGHIYLRSRQWAQGLDYLRQSLAMFERIGFEEFLTELYRRLAEAYLGQGDLNEAHAWARKSLERALATETKLEEGCTRRVLGSLYRAQGHPAKAQAQFTDSLRILHELESPYQAARTMAQLAALHAEQGTDAQAKGLLAQARTTLKKLGAELDLSRLES
jgi:tetratricopeptide (TPR) repeat protein